MSQIHPAHRAVVPISDPNSPYYGQKGDDPANDPPGWYRQPPECAYGQDFINTHGFIGCVPHNSPKHTLQKGAIALGALAAPVAASIALDLGAGDAVVALARSEGAKTLDTLKSLRTPGAAAKFAAERAVDYAKEQVKDRGVDALRWIVSGSGGAAGVIGYAKHAFHAVTQFFTGGSSEQADGPHKQ